MNWNLIKKNQYKAYLKWVNWVMRDKYADNVTVESEIDETGREGYLVEWNSLGSNTFRGQDIRALYSFFDEQGIYTIINRSPADNEFFWSIDIDKDFCDGDYTNTRTEAEEQAFLKAFEILEDK